MAIPTPEEEGALVPAEEPAVPEQAPTVPEYAPAEPETPPVPMVPKVDVSAPSPIAEANPAVPEELMPQVQELVDVAFNEGTTTAVEKARATGNAALIDALHATLSEPEMHDALESRGKLPAA
ncbi:MAG TPA: hypothetical protein VJ553_04880 [Candidatus Paceibacterota bacterium]|nr:hypothetical protein [Candidatus Paceibacterota bacterium]